VREATHESSVASEATVVSPVVSEATLGLPFVRTICGVPLGPRADAQQGRYPIEGTPTNPLSFTDSLQLICLHLKLPGCHVIKWSDQMLALYGLDWSCLHFCIAISAPHSSNRTYV
jgi:hypothetical protein